MSTRSRQESQHERQRAKMSARSRQVLGPPPAALGVPGAFKNTSFHKVLFYLVKRLLLGVNVRIASPKGFEPTKSMLEKAKKLSIAGAKIEIFNEPSKAVHGANAIYTDVWASMGQESEKIDRLSSFKGFCLNKK